MTRNSIKKQVIKLLTEMVIHENILFDDKEPTAVMESLAIVLSFRYYMPRTCVPKIDLYVKMNLLQQLDDERCRQEIRMNMGSFNQLFDLIKNSKYYVSIRRPQTEIKIQMMVALERLGCYGNGISVGRLARSTGIGGKIMSINDIQYV